VEIEIIPLASKKIERRKIERGLIEEAILDPDQTVEGYAKREVRQKIYTIEGKRYLLRVICEKEQDKIIVITAYLTSQIKRYWR